MRGSQEIRVKASPSFVVLLQLLFIGLKLTGYIAWSWWWVLSPFLFVGGVWAVLIIVALCAAVSGRS